MFMMLMLKSVNSEGGLQYPTEIPLCPTVV